MTHSIYIFVAAHWGAIVALLSVLYLFVTAFISTAPPHLPSTPDEWYCWVLAGLRQFINLRHPPSSTSAI